MPTETGYWTAEEALENHDFSYELARYIAEILPKEEMLIDMGCGRGVYLRYLHERGFQNLLGLEGEVYSFNYFGNIQQQDLSVEFKRDKIGNTLFLEVGEHIPMKYESIVIDNVCSNTKNKLIMSWAIIDQGGFHHVNCKHNIWIINEIEKRGFKPIWDESLEARSRIEERMKYFRNTLLVFDRINQKK